MRAKPRLSRVVALSGVALVLGCGTATSGGDAAQGPRPTVSTSPSSTSPSLTAPPSKPLGTPVPPPTGKPPLVTPGQFMPEVVWRGDTLIVTAFGSSLCQPVADEALAVDQHTLVVRFDDPAGRPGQACTDDYAPHRTRIPAPAGDIDLSSDVYATFELAGAPLQRIPVELFHPVLN